jgi:hypothetical protein
LFYRVVKKEWEKAVRSQGASCSRSSAGANHVIKEWRGDFGDIRHWTAEDGRRWIADVIRSAMPPLEDISSRYCGAIKGDLSNR